MSTKQESGTEVLEREWVLAPWEVAEEPEQAIRIEPGLVTRQGERLQQMIRDHIDAELERLRRTSPIRAGWLESPNISWAQCVAHRGRLWTGGSGYSRADPTLLGYARSAVWHDEASDIEWVGPAQQAFMTLGDPEVMYTPKIDVS